MSNQKISAGKITRITQTHNLSILEICPKCPSKFEKFAPIDFTKSPHFDTNQNSDDNFFFYIAEKHSKEDLLFVEKGIAIQKGDKIHRIQPLFNGKNLNNVSPTNRLYDFTASDDEISILYTYTPSNYVELLVFPHSLITSNDNSVQVTTMPEYSVLGRLDDNIEALDSQEMGEIINKSIESQGHVSPKQLRLAPSTVRPKSPTPGTIIFNSRNKSFEGFNGNHWITLGQ